MSINELSKRAHENAKAKGFFDKERDLGEMLMLIVSEVSEALEADRIDRYYDPATRCRILKNTEKEGGWAFEIVDNNDEAWANWFRSEVKNTFQDELADVVIRILDLAAYKNIDLEWHVLQKMRYNEGRDKMHGKKY